MLSCWDWTVFLINTCLSVLPTHFHSYMSLYLLYGVFVCVCHQLCCLLRHTSCMGCGYMSEHLLQHTNGSWRWGCHVFPEPHCGNAQPRRVGYEGEAVPHGGGDQDVGHRLLRHTEAVSGRNPQVRLKFLFFFKHRPCSFSEDAKPGHTGDAFELNPAHTKRNRLVDFWAVGFGLLEFCGTLVPPS